MTTLGVEPLRFARVPEESVKVDVDAMSDRLAGDGSITDYEFWRALKTVEDALYRAGRQSRPIPMDLIFTRAILRKARLKRGGRDSQAGQT